MSSGHDSGEHLRGEAVRTRVMVADTLCAIAERDVRGGLTNKAVGSILAIRRIIREIEVLVSEPNLVSPDATRELLAFLSELESRTQMIEALIGPSIND
jgi:hypothetical protein